MLQRLRALNRLKWVVAFLTIGEFLAFATSGNGNERLHSIPVTKDLDMGQVAIEVEGTNRFNDVLQKQLEERFSKSGIPVAPLPLRSGSTNVTLRFTQKEIPLEPSCPLKVFYIARRELIEPVRIKRNNQLIALGHWDHVTAQEVRSPLPLVELSKSLNDQIDGFLRNYALGNSLGSGVGKQKELESNTVRIKKVPQNSHIERALGDHVKTVLNWEVWSELDHLNLDQLFWGQGDDSYTEYKTAKHRLRSAGITLHTRPGETSVPESASKLIFTLNLFPLGDECPGYVVYKLGLVISELVLLDRNGVEKWADTWGSYRVQVRPALTMKDMEQDQLQLIDRFIHDYKATHPIPSDSHIRDR
jgi:hypothetical protein